MARECRHTVEEEINIRNNNDIQHSFSATLQLFCYSDWRCAAEPRPLFHISVLHSRVKHLLLLTRGNKQPPTPAALVSELTKLAGDWSREFRGPFMICADVWCKEINEKKSSITQKSTKNLQHKPGVIEDVIVLSDLRSLKKIFAKGLRRIKDG